MASFMMILGQMLSILSLISNILETFGSIYRQSKISNAKKKFLTHSFVPSPQMRCPNTRVFIGFDYVTVHRTRWLVGRSNNGHNFVVSATSFLFVAICVISHCPSTSVPFEFSEFCLDVTICIIILWVWSQSIKTAIHGIGKAFEQRLGLSFLQMYIYCQHFLAFCSQIVSNCFPRD